MNKDDDTRHIYGLTFFLGKLDLIDGCHLYSDGMWRIDGASEAFGLYIKLLNFYAAYTESK